VIVTSVVIDYVHLAKRRKVNLVALRVGDLGSL
jgi:hypothetical protein